MIQSLQKLLKQKMDKQYTFAVFQSLQFRVDLIKVNWGSFCHDADPNSVLEHFLKFVEKLLDKHAPYKIIKHSKSQFETKPWITPGLAYSIQIKNKLYKCFCKDKDPHKKKIMEDNSKHTINQKYRN